MHCNEKKKGKKEVIYKQTILILLCTNVQTYVSLIIRSVVNHRLIFTNKLFLILLSYSHIF